METCRLSTASKSGRFYSWEIDHNSKENLSRPLLVNVAGCINASTFCENINRAGRLDHYLLFIVSGSATVKTNHGVKDISKNDLIIIHSRESYAVSVKELPLCYLCVHFTGSEADKRVLDYGLSFFPCVNRLDSKNQMELRFKSLFEAFTRNDDLRDTELALLLERLLIEASRGVSCRPTAVAPLSKSIRYVNEFYTKPIKITDLAYMEGMCMTSYNLAFKKQMKMPPSKYIIKLRMEHSAEFLETSNLSIGEIAASCGYSDINFFSRTFKDYFGISPTDYRRRALANVNVVKSQNNGFVTI